jgi:putative DNA primase/helicase
MSNNNAFAIAMKYHTLQRCVIPPGGGPDGKSVLMHWKRYQTERPTDTQLDEWLCSRCHPNPEGRWQ